MEMSAKEGLKVFILVFYYTTMCFYSLEVKEIEKLRVDLLLHTSNGTVQS